MARESIQNRGVRLASTPSTKITPPPRPSLFPRARKSRRRSLRQPQTSSRNRFALFLALLAIVGQLGFEPAHIRHHLQDGACETTSTSTHDECADCAIFHSGVASPPALEIGLVPPSIALTFVILTALPEETLLPIVCNSRAPPSYFA